MEYDLSIVEIFAKNANENSSTTRFVDDSNVKI